MSHKLLDNCDIHFIFTKASAKSVTKGMDTKVRHEYRLTSLCFGMHFFGGIDFFNDPHNGSVNIMSAKQITRPVAKNKIATPI